MNPRTAVFVPARLKSKRLKRKAFELIGNKSSIEWCLENSKKIRNVDEVILLTSNLKQDDKLAKYKFGKKYKVFRGSPENLIKRFIDAANKFKIDTIIRVTGDCPFISKEIMSSILSPTPKKQIGFLCFLIIEMAAPPFAVPSILFKTTPSMSI